MRIDFLAVVYRMVTNLFHSTCVGCFTSVLSHYCITLKKAVSPRGVPPPPNFVTIKVSFAE